MTYFERAAAALLVMAAPWAWAPAAPQENPEEESLNRG